MALVRSLTALGTKPLPTSFDVTGGKIVVEHVIAATLTTSDVLELCTIPANMRVVDFMLYSEDLDSNGAPTFEFEFGTLNTAKDDIDTAYTVATVNIGETGGIYRMLTNAAVLDDGVRVLGIQPSTGAATADMVGKKIGVVLHVVPI